MVLANRYALEATLGEGGFAEVYRARDLQRDALVAVKVLCTPDDSDVHARFRQEAMLLAGLEHPHIVGVLDFAAEPQCPPFLVMEYVEGPSLRQLLRTRAWAAPAAQTPDAPALPLPLVLQVAYALLDALGYLHGRGVVHRDVKPENVLLGPSGVKLVDFGLARPPARDAATTTTRFTVLGTLHYMAPEQALGIRVDGRADLYALGVVLYELLSGNWPYPQETLMGLATGDSRVGAPPQPPPHPAIPPALAPVLLRLLSLSPGQRYPDAATVEAALAAVAPRPTGLVSGYPLTSGGIASAETVPAEPTPLPLPSVLASLPAGVLRLLAARLAERSFAPGEWVLRQGEPGESLHLVASGRFAVEQELPDGSRRRVATVGPGDIFGELALIDGEPRSASVRALRRGSTRVLTRADFLAVVREHPDVALAIMGRLTHMVRHLTAQLASGDAPRRRGARRAARHG
jgi:CRP-like cAMP-binding protein